MGVDQPPPPPPPPPPRDDRSAPERTDRQSPPAESPTARGDALDRGTPPPDSQARLESHFDKPKPEPKGLEPPESGLRPSPEMQQHLDEFKERKAARSEQDQPPDSPDSSTGGPQPASDTAIAPGRTADTSPYELGQTYTPKLPEPSGSQELPEPPASDVPEPPPVREDPERELSQTTHAYDPHRATADVTKNFMGDDVVETSTPASVEAPREVPDAGSRVDAHGESPGQRDARLSHGRALEGDPRTPDWKDRPDDYDRYGADLPLQYPERDDIYCDESREQHILKGHRPGADIPTKTEFPADWSDDDIMAAVDDVARNPDSVTDAEQDGLNARFTVYGERNGVPILVALKSTGAIWTAFPYGRWPRN